MSVAGHGNGAKGNVHKVEPTRLKLFLTKGGDIISTWRVRAGLGKRPTVSVQGGVERYVGGVPEGAAKGFLDYLGIR